MNTLVIVLIAAVCLFGAYMLYGRWLANKGLRRKWNSRYFLKKSVCMDLPYTI